MTVDLMRMSTFLSLVLRRKPEEIGLTLDEHGWADVEEWIRASGTVSQLYSLCRPGRWPLPSISSSGQRTVSG